MKDIYEQYTKEDLWLIREDKFVRGLQGIRETQFALGNGYLGTRSVLEEIPYDAHAGTYITGIYDRLTAQVAELVNLPNPFNFRLTANGEKIDIVAMDVLEHCRILNMKKGLLLRKTLYSDSKKRRYNYQSLRFVSMDNKNIGGMQIVLTPLDGACEIDINTGIDTSVHNAGVLTEGLKKHFRVKELGQEKASGYLLVETYEKKHIILYRSGFYYEINGKKTFAKDNIFKLKLNKNQTVIFTKVFYITNFSPEEKLNRYKSESLKEFHRAFRSDFESLLKGHIKTWENIWKKADVQIVGTGTIQKNFRFIIYHMVIGARENAGFSSIGARTLTGEGYRGHIFWDTEIFLLPFYAFIMPQIARSILLYRYRRLDQARDIAKKYGYKGAMFPWESADTGEEETPTWAKNIDGSIIKILTDKFEHHITADIAYAIYRYYVAAADVKFMENYGYEMLFETASFWASRVEYNKKKNKYEIKHVIGPDEFHGDVNNNAYTNMMAKLNLTIAYRMFCQLKNHSPKIYKKLQKKIDLRDKDARIWKRISDQMMPLNLGKNSAIEQFDGFFKLRNVLCAETDENGIPLLPKKIKPKDFGKTQLVKQADVLMLLYLLPDLFNFKTKKSNYDFYIHRTLHTSSLSFCIHSLIALECGDIDKAYHFFNLSLRADISNLHRNTEKGIHGASLGGTWQAVIHGFAGVKIRRDILCINPRMPHSWQKMIFSICWKADHIKLKINNNTVKIKIISRKKKKTQIEIFNRPYNLETNKDYSFKRKLYVGEIGHYY